MNYAVEIRDGRYIQWCDEHWYETDTNLRYFTKEEAESIVEQMKNHYTYKAVLVGEDGERIYYPKPKTNPMLECKEEKTKKSIFKFKMNN